MEKKYCMNKECGKELVIGKNEHASGFKKRKYCSKYCANVARRQGFHPWNYNGGGNSDSAK